MPPRVHDHSSGLHISGTREQLFVDCRRAWAFEYIAGIPRPSTDSQLKGTALHWVGEHWLRDSIPPAACPAHPDPDVSRFLPEMRGRFAAGVAFLPVPKTEGLSVEASFAMPLSCGANITGTIDYYVLVPGHDPDLGDHKTTKGFQYVKTPEQLQGNIQCLFYSYYLALKAHADRVNAQWTYYRTIGAPCAVPSRTVLERPRLERAWRRIDEIGCEMHALWQAHTDPLSIEGNKEHCRAYGGCHYFGICQKRDQKMSSAVAVSASEGSSIFQVLKAGALPAAVAPRGTASAEDIFAGANSVLTLPAINPPAVQAVPMPGPAAQPATPLVAGFAPAPAPSNAAPSDAAPKRRGRPPKAAAESVLAPTPQTAAAAVTTIPPGACPVEVHATAGETLTLFMRCLPTRGFTAPRVVRTASDLKAAGSLVGAIMLPADADTSVAAVLEAAADFIVKAC